MSDLKVKKIPTPNAPPRSLAPDEPVNTKKLLEADTDWYTVPNQNVQEILDESGNFIGYTRDKQPISGVSPIHFPATIMIRSINPNVKKIDLQTNKFIITNITKPRMERFQIVETFGASALYFFNERTKVYTFSGEVADAFFDGAPKEKYLWGQMLQSLYNDHLRATLLAERQRIAILSADRMMLQGYPVQLNISKTADRHNLMSFQMTWIVTKEILMDRNKIREAYDSPMQDGYANWLERYLALYEEYTRLIDEINQELFGDPDGLVDLARANSLKQDLEEVEKKIREQIAFKPDHHKAARAAGRWD